MTIRKTLIFLGFFTAHWLAQFVAWSLAQQNPVAGSLWLILSAPTAYVFDAFMNEFFVSACILNSLIWAAMFSLVLPLTFRSWRATKNGENQFDNDG